MYYDRILLFEAKDDDGRNYISTIADESDPINSYYLTIELDEDSLVRFKQGKEDLRELILNKKDKTWFIAKANGGAINDPLELILQNTPIENSEYLPVSGFKLWFNASSSDFDFLN